MSYNPDIWQKIDLLKNNSRFRDQACELEIQLQKIADLANILAPNQIISLFSKSEIVPGDGDAEMQQQLAEINQLLNSLITEINNALESKD